MDTTSGLSVPQLPVGVAVCERLEGRSFLRRGEGGINNHQKELPSAVPSIRCRGEGAQDISFLWLS